MARLTFLLLALWVGVTMSKVLDLQKRIYNGYDCGPTERLYQVRLFNNLQDTNSVCGGSLIHPKWVLTAAHCCTSMYAEVGVHPGPGTREVIQEKLIYLNHDIMLLKLPNSVTGITPVPLPDANECKTKPNVGEEVQMAGHGGYLIDPTTKKKLPDQPAKLQCAKMHISKCDNAAIQHFRPNEPAGNWICYEESNVDTCKGDSGGGMIYKGKLRGVHIGDGDYACTVHAVSLDVCSYKTWIDNNAK